MPSLCHGSPAFCVAIRQKRHWAWFGDPGLPSRVLCPSVTPRGGGERDDEEAQVARSRPTWTIPAVGGQAWAGTGPPRPTCLEALSDTSLQA